MYRGRYLSVHGIHFNGYLPTHSCCTTRSLPSTGYSLPCEREQQNTRLTSANVKLEKRFSKKKTRLMKILRVQLCHRKKQGQDVDRMRIRIQRLQGLCVLRQRRGPIHTLQEVPREDVKQRNKSHSSKCIQILNMWMETDAHNLHNQHSIGVSIKLKHQNNNTHDNKAKKNT